MSKNLENKKVEEVIPTLPTNSPKNESVFDKIDKKIKSKFSDKEQEIILEELSKMIKGEIVLTKEQQKKDSEFILLLKDIIRENISDKKGKELVKEILEVRDTYIKNKKIK